MSRNWNVLIGLEVHVQLKTKTKIFSPALNKFGSEPNVNIHPCCMGLPGSLPMVSEESVSHAIKLGIALDSEINKESEFERKAYFYPDSPRNYQITQFSKPIISGGRVTIFVGDDIKKIRIKEAHIEDDSGLMKHLPSLTAIDFNRAGVPLIEIVTMPDMTHPAEAVSFVLSIKNILKYLDISDCDMENGNLRVDANVSVTKDINVWNNKCEIKNLNSLNILAKAIQKEIDRQINFYENNPNEQITSSTYRWSNKSKDLVLMREKTSFSDYMYFKEPDLLTLLVTDSMIAEAKKNMPELPLSKMNRFMKDYGLDLMSAEFLVSDIKLAEFFEEIVSITKNPKMSYNWMCSDFSKYFECPIYESTISFEHIADLICLVDKKVISTKTAKEIIPKIIETCKKASQIVIENPELKLTDLSFDIDQTIKDVINSNMQSVNDYKNGKKRAFDFLVGKILQQLKNTDPNQVRTKALEYINSINN